MVDSYDKGSSGIVCGVSRRAGAVAGTSVVLSKKIANCGFKTITVAKGCLKQPLKRIVPAKDKNSSSISHDSAIKSTDVQETDRKKAAKAIIASLESKLGSVQQRLEKAQSKAEKTQAELASQLKKLEAEKESLVSQLQNTHKETEAEVVKVDKEGEQMERVQTSILNEQEKEEERKVESRAARNSNKRKSSGKVVEPALAQPEELDTETEEQVSDVALEANDPQSDLEASIKPEIVETCVSEPEVVTKQDVRIADFDNETERILFARALADISSQDANIRVDAVKAMACISHILTIKTLTAQMVCESSVLVRRECIKALAAIGMAESIPAVEHSLRDEAGSVRLAGVWGLYHLAGEKSAPALIQMLADNDEEVRRRAVTCLGWLGNKELVVELLPLLDDKSISVRRAVVEAMISLRSRQVVSALIDRLNDPVESIRKLVLRAIETITGKKMSKFFPKDEKEFERLVVRWRQWRKEQLAE